MTIASAEDPTAAMRSARCSLFQSDDAKSAYWQMHGSQEGANGRNKGAHFEYLEQLLARNGGGNGFAVGSSLTAADICLWEIVDLHMRIFKEEMEGTVSQTAGYDYLCICIPSLLAQLSVIAVLCFGPALRAT